MRGVIHLLPNTLWRGAQLKKKAQGQLYLTFMQCNILAQFVSVNKNVDTSNKRI
jgi:hypothetical protein